MTVTGRERAMVAAIAQRMVEEAETDAVERAEEASAAQRDAATASALAAAAAAQDDVEIAFGLRSASSASAAIRRAAARASEATVAASLAVSARRLSSSSAVGLPTNVGAARALLRAEGVTVGRIAGRLFGLVKSGSSPAREAAAREAARPCGGGGIHSMRWLVGEAGVLSSVPSSLSTLSSTSVGELSVSDQTRSTCP